MIAAVSAGRAIPGRIETRSKTMNHPTSCLAERLFSVGAGITLLVVGAVIAVFSLITLPFIGLIVAAPPLIISVFLLAAARRAECPVT
jgi:hypothetical protein